jgi:hypothetical protein
MTRSIKMLGLAFVAMLAFGVAGVGSASALLFLSTLASELFTVKTLNTASNPIKIETKGSNLFTCNSILGHGSILNKTDRADKILLTLHECKNAVDESCQSAGEPSGLITTLDLDALLVTTLSGHYAFLLLAEKGNVAEFACSSGLAEEKIVATGNIAGEFTESKAESEMEKTERKLEFTKGTNAGEQAIKDYWTLEGVQTAKLEFTLSGPINEKAEATMMLVLDIVTPHPGKYCHK